MPGREVVPCGSRWSGGLPRPTSCTGPFFFGPGVRQRIQLGAGSCWPLLPLLAEGPLGGWLAREVHLVNPDDGRPGIEPRRS
jgi:hypothetical protein